MKRCLSLFLLLALVLLCACGSPGHAAQEVPDGPDAGAAGAAPESPTAVQAAPLDFFRQTRTESETAPDGTALCEVRYAQLSLSQEDAAAYPALARALETINADVAGAVRGAYAQLLAAAQSDWTQRAADAADGGDAFEPFYRRDELYLPRADSRAVSVLYRMTSFSGGVHGNYYYYSYNIDSATGRILNLRSVVPDMAAFRAALEDALHAAYPEAGFAGMEAALNDYIADPSAFTWTLDYQGLSFFFSPGELSDYDDGAMCCSLRFADFPDLFSAYYTVVPGRYAVPLIGGSTVDYDADLDGRADAISVTRIFGEEDAEMSEALALAFNGKTYTANTPLCDCDCYVLNTAPGRSFLFISAQNLTGYGYISVYRLSRSGVSLAGMLYDSSLVAVGYAGGMPGEALLTDPADFLLGTRVQTLGTLTGIRRYATGEDGMPVSEDSNYALYGGPVLTLRQPLAVATLDAQTLSGAFATETLPAGTQLHFLRGDGTGSVDMFTDEGIYCRFYVSGKPGSQRVNGMAVEEVFDGIVY